MVETRLRKKLADRTKLGSLLETDVLEVILRHMPLHHGISLFQASKALYYGDIWCHIGAKWLYEFKGIHTLNEFAQMRMLVRWRSDVEDTPIWKRADLIVNWRLIGLPSTHDGSVNANESDLVYTQPGLFA